MTQYHLILFTVDRWCNLKLIFSKCTLHFCTLFILIKSPGKKKNVCLNVLFYLQQNFKLIIYYIIEISPSSVRKSFIQILVFSLQKSLQSVFIFLIVSLQQINCLQQISVAKGFFLNSLEPTYRGLFGNNSPDHLKEKLGSQSKY